MFSDRAGLEVSAESASTVAALDHFAVEVLSHGQQAGALFATARADPRAPLAQAYAGALYLFLQTREGVQEAWPWLQRARNACELFGCTRRESLLVTALEMWAQGDAQQAAALHVEVARRWPHDLLNLKLAQTHQINLGDRHGMVSLARLVAPFHRDAEYASGIFAFAHEQAGELGAAKHHAERALQRLPHDAWAQHALAHVFEARGQTRECIRWIQSITQDWDRCSSFMYTHNWWHLALMHLDNDEPEVSLQIFDERVWAVRKTYVQDQINAVSLLSRLECRGVDVGHRWLDIAKYVAPRIHDRQNGFIDLHYGYALARAGLDELVSEWILGIGARAADQKSPTASCWNIALSAARGLAAHARDDMKSATRHLEPIATQLCSLGGSNAQQDWFELIQLDALIGAQQFQKASSLLTRRIRSRPSIRWQQQTFAALPGNTARFDPSLVNGMAA